MFSWFRERRAEKRRTALARFLRLMFCLQQEKDRIAETVDRFAKRGDWVILTGQFIMASHSDRKRIVSKLREVGREIGDLRPGEQTQLVHALNRGRSENLGLPTECPDCTCRKLAKEEDDGKS